MVRIGFASNWPLLVSIRAHPLQVVLPSNGVLDFGVFSPVFLEEGFYDFGEIRSWVGNVDALGSDCAHSSHGFLFEFRWVVVLVLVRCWFRLRRRMI